MAKAKKIVDIEPTGFVMKMVKPKNEKQKIYMDLLNDKERPLILATGLAGTSKSYIASYVAARKLHNGEVQNIFIVRPPISDSKSLGFFGGDLLTKCLNWSAPVTNALIEFLGREQVNKYLEEGVIQPIPLEVIKGWTLKKSFTIVDEAEDCNFSEFKKISTRLGEDGTIVFCGDVCQVDLKCESGLAKAVELLKDHPDLFDWSHVDFNNISDIVRSESVKKTISAYRKLGLM